MKLPEMVQGLYIDGEWRQTVEDEVQQSTNPANKQAVGYYTLATKEQVNEAVKSAKASFLSWRKHPVPARASYLWKIAEQLEANKAKLAEMMTMEMGKPLTESLGEVGVVIETCRYMAGEGKRLFGETVPSSLANCLITMRREPLGAIACITPWNFPVALAGYKILAALICGNTVVWKPASEVALSAGIFVDCIHEAGLPRGVVNLVTGSGRKVGPLLAEHKDIQGVSFTGSTEVGIQLAERAARHLKRITLELGGKNAAIVLKDTNLNLTAEAIVRAAFSTTGQKCTATSRVIVEEEIHDQLLEKVIACAEKLRVGDGLEKGTVIGPLVNEAQLDTVKEFVRIAVEEGANVRCGGREPINRTGFFYEPTILTEVLPGHTIAQEEIFGPVLCFIKVKDFEEAIAVNNDTKYGLSTSIFTESLHFANRGASEVETGLVYINNGTANAELGVPFGGYKQSGNGHREVSHHAFESLTEWKAVYTRYER